MSLSYLYLLYCLQLSIIPGFKFQNFSALPTFTHFSKEISFGNSCIAGMKCASNTICKQGVCQCSAEYPIYSNGKCNLGSGFYEECTLQYNLCPLKVIYGQCIDNVCKCPPEKPVYSNSKCITGPKCDFEKCDNGRVCVNQSCQCKPGTVDIGNQCIKGVPFGKPCINELQCRISNTFSHCINGWCRCPTGTFKLLNNGTYRCEIEGVALYKPCFNDWQCQNKTAGSICSDGICMCPSQSFPNENECLKDVTFGNRCNKTIQCHQTIYLSQCINGICSCPANRPKLEESTMSCKEVISCTTTEDCVKSYKNSECIHDICKCTEYFPIAMREQCYKEGMVLNMPCLNDRHCLHKLVGSTCYNGNCMCPSQSFPNENECLTDVQIGGHCDKTSQCHHPIHFSQCINGTCSCPANKPILDESTMSCKEGIYGSKCSYNHDCNFYQSDCISGYCSCRNGFVYSYGRCQQLLTTAIPGIYGSECFSDSQCKFYQSACISGYCTCIYPNIYSDGRCQFFTTPTSSGMYGSKCFYSTECNFYHSECISGYCECSSSYVYSNGICNFVTKPTSGFNFSVENLLIGVCVLIAFFAILMLIFFISRCRRVNRTRIPPPRTNTSTNLLQDFHTSVYQLENPPNYEEIYPSIPNNSQIAIIAPPGNITMQSFILQQRNVPHPSSLNPAINNTLPSYATDTQADNSNCINIDTGNECAQLTFRNNAENNSSLVAQSSGNKNNTQIEEAKTDDLDANKRY